MHAQVLPHETVRIVGQQLESFQPPPAGNWGHLLRGVKDTVLKLRRVWIQTYVRDIEKQQALVSAIDIGVRAVAWEAARRVLHNEADEVRRGAYCSVMTSLQDIESILEHKCLRNETDEMGVMTDWTQHEVQKLAERVKAGDSSIEDVLGWGTVMEHPFLREELASLMRCSIETSHLTKVETRSFAEEDPGCESGEGA